MKIRAGLVSNSSSSSFICEVCGNTESGWDAYGPDLGFCECEHGHVFCLEHILIDEPEIKEEWIDFVKDDPYATFTYKGYEFDSEVPEALCPCCQMKNVSNNDFNRWLTKTGKMAELKKEFTEKFKTYNEFQKWLKV